MDFLVCLLREVAVPAIGTVIAILLRQVSKRLRVVGAGQAVVADTARTRFIVRVGCCKALSGVVDEPRPSARSGFTWQDEAVSICHDAMLSSGMDPSRYNVRGLVDAWAFRHRDLVEQVPKNRR